MGDQFHVLDEEDILGFSCCYRPATGKAKQQLFLYDESRFAHPERKFLNQIFS